MAAFVCQIGANVKLRTEAGREITVPRDKLSQQDLDHIESLHREKRH